MTREEERGAGQPAPAFLPDPIDPNFPEVSGTTLPLLSGILAGFAITAVVALALDQADGSSVSSTSKIAVTAMLLSVVCFLNSIVFAIKAQASNYLPFLDLSRDALSLLNIQDINAWISRLEKRWFLFHAVAIGSFYLGALLFLVALNLIVWVFVGAIVGLIFLLAVLAMVASAVLSDLLGTAWLQRQVTVHARRKTE